MARAVVLSEIRIESLGAISTATAEFDRGLTVLTGETGTGKTMVVTGLHLLGGARADATRIRSGAPRAVVEGRFSTRDLGDDVDRFLGTVTLHRALELLEGAAAANEAEADLQRRMTEVESLRTLR